MMTPIECVSKDRIQNKASFKGALSKSDVTKPSSRPLTSNIYCASNHFRVTGDCFPRQITNIGHNINYYYFYYFYYFYFYFILNNHLSSELQN